MDIHIQRLFSLAVASTLTADLYYVDITAGTETQAKAIYWSNNPTHAIVSCLTVDSAQFAPYTGAGRTIR